MKTPQEDPPRRPGETAIYEDDPFEFGEAGEADLKIVKDFLPRPAELVARDQTSETEKVTMVFDKVALDFFRQEAKRRGASYEQMIRKLVSDYAARHRAAGHD